MFPFCISSSCPVLTAACFHCCLCPFVLPMPFILSTDSPPPVLYFSCRITLHFNVLRQSLMYLNPLIWLVSYQSKFPLRFSISHLCVPSSFFFIPQNLNADSVPPSKSASTSTTKIYSWFLFASSHLDLIPFSTVFMSLSMIPCAISCLSDQSLMPLHTLYLYQPRSALLLTARPFI